MKYYNSICYILLYYLLLAARRICDWWVHVPTHASEIVAVMERLSGKTAAFAWVAQDSFFSPSGGSPAVRVRLAAVA